MTIKTALALALMSALRLAAESSAPSTSEIRWQPWSDGVFAQARSERRFVLLDLGAVWCHWCHVMEETTYKDADVVRLIGARYLPVQVDQDARPDLSNRYEDYGWPATIIFAADGSELVKFRGYIPPRRMVSLLQALIDDPTPGPSVTMGAELETSAPTSGAAPDALRAELRELLVSRYDEGQGGWGFAQKFLDWDAAEYALLAGRQGDRRLERMARESLDKQLKLIDPVWGGVYQYSDSGDWDHPHYEKIMQMQSENLRLYALAYGQWKDPRYLEAARAIERYLATFLSAPDGTFYTSQDADLVAGEHSAEYFALDDAGRRARGVPRVDTHRYARENAWAAGALLSLHAVTGEARLRDRAVRVAQWLLAERALPGGGFRHDARDTAGPYLGDDVAALRLFVALYAVTADRAWLDQARTTTDFVLRTFRTDAPGFVTAATPDAALPARPQRDENVSLVRTASLLHAYTGDTRYREIVQTALVYLTIPGIARQPQTGGVLLALADGTSDPLHVTVVGPADSDDARALLLSALSDPRAFKRVELWDKRTGPLPRADVSYPQLARPAAFVCTAGQCSSPCYTPEQLNARLARMTAE
jgi:uncharacterized protein